MVIVDAKQIPSIAVNDPTMMLGLPSYITAATGMDALTHASEAYASKGTNTAKLNDFEAADLATQRMKKLANEVGIPSCLSELGIDRKDMDAWIDKAMIDVCRGSNPVNTSEEDILNLYIKAL
ncbi:iron-containing alcohol dehydrogenase [Vibrio mimicus]